MKKYIFVSAICILFSLNIIAQNRNVQRIEINYVNPSITSIVPISCSEFDTTFHGKIKKRDIDSKDKIAAINKSVKLIYAKNNDEIDVRGKIYFFADKELKPFLEFCYDKFFIITHNGKALNKKSMLYLNLRALLRSK